MIKMTTQPRGAPVVSIDDFQAFDAATHFPKNFFACCFAPRRSGKTQLLLHFLRQFHKTKRFTHYFLVSETLSGYEDYIPATNSFTDLSQVSEIVARMQAVGKYNQNQKKKETMVKCSICLILDDVIGDPSEIQKRGSIIAKLAVNGRHVCHEDPMETNQMAILLISQRVTLIPPVIRHNSDIIFVSRLASYADRKTLIEGYLSLTSDREGLALSRATFDTITLSKPFRFMAIATHMVSSRNHSEYVFIADADTKAKPVRLCGCKADWDVVKKNIVF
jgi:hypothetical protein